MESDPPSPFHPSLLRGKVALVTGGSSGIGLCCACQIALHNAKGIVIMGRRREVLESACKYINERVKSVSAGRASVQVEVAVASAGDVRNPEDCKAAVDVALRCFKGLDILINAAGKVRSKPVGQF